MSNAEQDEWHLPELPKGSEEVLARLGRYFNWRNEQLIRDKENLDGFVASHAQTLAGGETIADDEALEDDQRAQLREAVRFIEGTLVGQMRELQHLRDALELNVLGVEGTVKPAPEITE